MMPGFKIKWHFSGDFYPQPFYHGDRAKDSNDLNNLYKTKTRAFTRICFKFTRYEYL